MSGVVGYHAGLAAEQAVARAYERIGKPIVASRWRGKGGEIDLIARDGDGFIFVEVKKSRTHARAMDRLSQRQMNRIMMAASEFVGTAPRGQLTDMRFDVATVDSIGEVRVLENAFPM